MKVEFKILVLFDSSILRHGFRSMLNNEKDFSIKIIESAHPSDVLRLAKEDSLDLIIADDKYVLPLTALHNYERTLLFTYSELDQNKINLIKSFGNAGMISFRANSSEFREAILVHLDNRLYFGFHQIRNNESNSKLNKIGNSSLNKLTKREFQVFKLLVKEISNGTIADKLNISIRTVEGYKHSISKKLNVKGVAGMTKIAISEGIESTSF